MLAGVIYHYNNEEMFMERFSCILCEVFLLRLGLLASRFFGVRQSPNLSY